VCLASAAAYTTVTVAAEGGRWPEFGRWAQGANNSYVGLFGFVIRLEDIFKPHPKEGGDSEGEW
jgi:hypothetical protein